MKRLFIPSQTKDASVVIENIINEAPDGCTVVFEKGTYHLSRAVCIKGKSGIVLDGADAVLAPYFNREEGAESGSEVFNLLGCENIAFCGFTVSSPVPVNTAGRIVDVTEEYAEVEMFSTVPVTGNEQFIDGGVFDDEMHPKNHYWVFDGYDAEKRTVIAGEIPCTNPRKLDTPHKLTDKGTIRVFSKRLTGLEKGMRISISHSYYGLAAFVFRQCKNMVIEDVKITNFAGFGFLILPHCRDFTFRRVTLATADKEHQPLALNSDGIHITGLSGSLVIEDCDFDCLGDDVLNVHTQVMTVSDICEDKMQLIFDKICGTVSPYWCEKGDKLRIYSSDDLTFKGYITVKEADRGDLVIFSDGTNAQKGDLVTADKYYPDVKICGCRFHGWRTRTMCLEGSKSLEISGCTFNNVTKKTIFCTTAFDHWMEAGPLCNVTIKDNLFIGLGEWYGGDSVIFVGIDGKRYQNVKPIHENVCVESNRFENIPGQLIEIHLTKGVSVKNNAFLNCNGNGENVVIDRSEDVVCEGNHPI